MAGPRSGFGVRVAALVLLTTSLLGGPGLTLAEAWYHTHQASPSHARGIHVEAKSTWHHDDLCYAGRVLQSFDRVRARLALVVNAPIRSPGPTIPAAPAVPLFRWVQPPSRGPPLAD